MTYQMPSSIRIETGEHYNPSKLSIVNAITGEVVPNILDIAIGLNREGMHVVVYHTKNWPIQDEDKAANLTEAQLWGKTVLGGIVLAQTTYHIKTLNLEASRANRSGD